MLILNVLLKQQFRRPLWLLCTVRPVANDQGSYSTALGGDRTFFEWRPCQNLFESVEVEQCFQ